jgi:capsular polysaccharide export protein
MSKLTKLIKTPHAFAGDALDKRYPARKLRPKILAAQQSGKPTALLVGFSNWKTWMVDALPDYHVAFMGHSPRIAIEMLQAVPKFPNVTVFAWSYKYPDALNEICEKNDIPIVYVEDGFIRSIGLGIAKSAPLSLVFDRRAMHFDRQRISALDDLLNTTDFTEEPAARALADQVIAMAKSGVTKYIKAESVDAIEDHFFREAGVRNILVLGQVEDDMSIRCGMEKPMTGNDLVRLVALNNPEANIFYRPHPEAIERRKKHYSNPNDVKGMCQIVGRRWSLKETFRIVDEVHTMTSLAGFEAAMHGLDVHTYGMPFYAGWGFTTDHGLSGVTGKRQRSITLQEAIAGAYVLYPQYFDPISKGPIDAARGIAVADAMNRRMKHDMRIKTAIVAHKERASQVAENGTSGQIGGSVAKQVNGAAIVPPQAQADHIVAVIKDVARRFDAL